MILKRKGVFQELEYQKKEVKHRKVDLTPKYLKSFSFESYNSTVKLYESRSRLRKVSCTRARISKYHILEVESTGYDIFSKIMSMNVGLIKYDKITEKNIDFTNIIPILSPILEKFKKQHKRFQYYDELRHIMNKTEKKLAKQKYNIGQIHLYLLKSFFGFMLYKNVPLQLFGTRQNLKAIKRTVCCLLQTNPKKIIIESSLSINRKVSLKTAIAGLLNLEPLLEKLDISKIVWLNPLQDIRKKWIIVLKLLHWFFTQYIIKIVHKYIVLISYKHQWLYIMKDDWCQMQHTFINEKVNRGDFLLDQSMPENGKICNKLVVNRLTVSSSGLRVIAKYIIEKESFKTEIILRFLQQLYSTYINKEGFSTVSICIEKIYKFKKSTNGHLYYVRCDIQDAFGSVKQEKLLGIIKNCCKQNLPLYLVMREYEKKNKKKKHKTTVQFLDMKLLKFRSIGTNISKKPQLVNWLKLISIIKKLLLNQKIELYDKVYLIKTGVPQGLQLSPIFSEIYYQDMFNNLFSEFKENGLLCKYVDDILYITEERNRAEQFLKTIKNDIPEYNVKFNPSKIQTNVALSPYKRTKIKYLGKDIVI